MSGQFNLLVRWRPARGFRRWGRPKKPDPKKSPTLKSSIGSGKLCEASRLKGGQPSFWRPFRSCIANDPNDLWEQGETEEVHGYRILPLSLRQRLR